jgi:hypothetical protein
MARLFPYTLKQTSIVALLGCLIIGGVAAIDSPRADNNQSVLISVNRTNKGDRLRSAAGPIRHPESSSAATKLSVPPHGPPLGCDPLFSPIADPAKARLYYRRCAV